MNRLLDKLENPNRPLLGPNVKSLEFWGLLLPSNIFKRLFYFCMHTIVFVFVTSEYIDIWYIKSNMTLLLNNLKITMLSTVSVVKGTTFLIWQKDWRNVIEYVTRADIYQRTTTNSKSILKITRYTKYCRKITYLYWFLMYTTVSIVVVQPIFKYFSSATYRYNVKNGTETYLQVVSSWVPFDKNTIPGYLAASAFQTYVSYCGGGWITSFDTIAIVVMVFFKTELELLKDDCENMFGPKSEQVPDEIAMSRLKEFHLRHIELVKFANSFDSCLSPILLLYMFVCSVMLCVTAYQITIEPDAMQRLLIAEYLIFGVAQLFIYCWHSNDVLFESENLTLGPYNSKWWMRNVKLQKDTNILASQFNKTIVFSAGPFNKLTVATFISILKGASSYYTLLSQSQMK